MQNGNHKNNGHHPNGAGNGLVHLNGNGKKARFLHYRRQRPRIRGGTGSPLGRAASRRHQGPGPAPGSRPIVSQRRGRAGMVYHYLEGHVVIDQANSIFGHGGWGYDLVGDVTLRQFEVVDPRTGEVKTSSAYSAPVRVTVAGAPSRTDVGFHAVAEETSDGHDTALKGAVTDGLKRALRSFGVQFGNGHSTETG